VASVLLELKGRDQTAEKPSHETTKRMGCSQWFEIMKRYTVRAIIHDAKIFNQLRLEYRRTNKKRPNDGFSGWLSRYLADITGCARA